MSLLQQLEALKKEHDSDTVRGLMNEVVKIMADHEDDRINRKLLNEVIEKTVMATRSLRSQMNMIEVLSVTDSLTQLYNRHKFNDEIDAKLAYFKRYHQTASLIMFDIDHFKRVNDTYGHNVGDAVLKHLSLLCRARVRATDILARWGGEEFVIMLPHTSQAVAVDLAEKIRVLISQEVFEDVGHLTCSFGVSEVQEKDTPESWVGRADKALYEAKQSGRNKVCQNS